VQEDGSVLGVVYLDSRVRSRLYTEKDLELLDAFTHYSVIAIEGAREREQLRRDVDSLRKLNLERVLEEHNFENVIHRSPAMTHVLEQVKAVAARDVTAVILGESGTGKELIARAIHHLSARAKGPFVAINCMALSRDLIESELFGHEKGAFSGAVARRQGRFELANGGTFLLDEVGELPPPVQGKLLRVLQEGEFERVGGTQAIRVDVRILGATHKDLRREVAEGRFREDLFYRINVFALDIPPLRRRPEDIPLLVSHFIGLFNQKMGRTIRGIEAAALQRLVHYPWPGNVRELRNVVERAFVLEPSDTLTQSSLPIDIAAGSATPAPRRPDSAGVRPLPSPTLAASVEPDAGVEAEELPSEETTRLDRAASSVDGGPAVLAIDSLPRDYESAREEFERVFLRAAIRRNQGNISEAARETGISRRHIYRMMKSLGL
jgi:two-component system NtrC family response regulator/two-component system response regulator HydG